MEIIGVLLLFAAPLGIGLWLASVSRGVQRRVRLEQEGAVLERLRR